MTQSGHRLNSRESAGQRPAFCNTALEATTVRELPTQSNHRDALNFNQNSRMGKVGHRDQGAAWKFSVGKYLVPDIDESVAVSRIVDRDSHGDEIGELAGHAIERPVDEGEAGPGLSLEIVCD